MRRILLLTAPLVAVMIVAGCRDDGRTLRPAAPDQTSTISTTVPDTGGEFVIPTLDDPVLDTIAVDDSAYPTMDPTAPRTITAPWRDGAAIDARHTCEGLNVAPALSWTPAPAGTVEIAVTMSDLDAPGFVHWVLAGLDPVTIALAEDYVPIGAVEATNGVGDLGYTGPCPPSGSTHSYVITVHYLGEASGLDDGAAGADMVARIEELTIASAEVIGTYSRP